MIRNILLNRIFIKHLFWQVLNIIPIKQYLTVLWILAQIRHFGSILFPFLKLGHIRAVFRLITILLMLTKRDDETNPTLTKRSYSYNDILKMQTDSAYTSIGKVLPSQKPSAARATFGSAERKTFNKLMAEN